MNQWMTQPHHGHFMDGWQIVDSNLKVIGFFTDELAARMAVKYHNAHAEMLSTLVAIRESELLNGPTVLHDELLAKLEAVIKKVEE